jgi:hypothetical protein
LGSSCDLSGWTQIPAISPPSIHDLKQKM